MKLKAYRLIAIAATVLLIAILLALFLLMATCCQSVGHHKPNTDRAPDHIFNHTAARNVTINGNFDFYFNHDIRVLESEGDKIELKAWADYMIPRVEFTGDGEDLTMNITISCAIDNDFGTPYASEYLYLPPGANYSINIEDQNGDIHIGRFTGESLRLVNSRGAIRIDGGNYSRVFVANDGKTLINESTANGSRLPVHL